MLDAHASSNTFTVLSLGEKKCLKKKSQNIQIIDHNNCKFVRPTSNLGIMIKELLLQFELDNNTGGNNAVDHQGFDGTVSTHQDST